MILAEALVSGQVERPSIPAFAIGASQHAASVTSSGVIPPVPAHYAVDLFRQQQT